MDFTDKEWASMRIQNTVPHGFRPMSIDPEHRCYGCGLGRDEGNHNND